MRLALLALLAVTGCADLYPPEPHNPRVDNPEWVERAAQVAAAEWSWRLGVDVDVPPIEYYGGECLVYDDEYMRDEWQQPGYCLIGRYWEDGWLLAEPWESAPAIDVLLRGGPSHDALAHELLHHALFLATGDANGPEHDDPMWAEVGAVNEAIRASLGVP